MDDALRSTLLGTNLLLSFIVAHFLVAYLVESTPYGSDILLTAPTTGLVFSCVTALQYLSQRQVSLLDSQAYLAAVPARRVPNYMSVTEPWTRHSTAICRGIFVVLDS